MQWAGMTVVLSTVGLVGKTIKTFCPYPAWEAYSAPQIP